MPSNRDGSQSSLGHESRSDAGEPSRCNSSKQVRTQPACLQPVAQSANNTRRCWPYHNSGQRSHNAPSLMLAATTESNLGDARVRKLTPDRFLAEPQSKPCDRPSIAQQRPIAQQRLRPAAQHTIYENDSDQIEFLLGSSLSAGLGAFHTDIVTDHALLEFHRFQAKGDCEMNGLELRRSGIKFAALLLSPNQLWELKIVHELIATSK